MLFRSSVAGNSGKTGLQVGSVAGNSGKTGLPGGLCGREFWEDGAAGGLCSPHELDFCCQSMVAPLDLLLGIEDPDITGPLTP